MMNHLMSDLGYSSFFQINPHGSLKISQTFSLDFCEILPNKKGVLRRLHIAKRTYLIQLCHLVHIKWVTFSRRLGIDSGTLDTSVIICGYIHWPLHPYIMPYLRAPDLLRWISFQGTSRCRHMRLKKSKRWGRSPAER